MKKVLLSMCLGFLAASASAQELKLPYYNANPGPADFSFSCQREFPNGQPAKVLSPKKLDVRSCDMSAWDLTQYTAQELADVISFDSKTKFPPKKKLPKGFSPKKILQNGKNPGLGVYDLHSQGITGKGVSMAIIDQNLLLNHREYASNVIFYEEDPFWKGMEASMHAPAVVSVAAGKRVGVAPQAQVFAFAANFQTDDSGIFDAGLIAGTLRRVAELNAQLPPKQKIRVVSISRGFDPRDHGSKEFEEAQKALEQNGVAVFTTNDIFTLNRTHSLDNPENVSAYCRPPYWFEKRDVGHLSNNTQDIFVPTAFRAIASPTGSADYVHYSNGGLSWGVPYVAGLYALGVQVYPQLTKEIFVKTALETSVVRSCQYEGVSFSARLVNPQALIDRLEQLKK